MTGRLWSPLDAQNFNDPYAMYSRLREEDPVHFAQTKEWIISRYADVKHVLRNSTFRAGNRYEWLARGIDYFKNKDDDLHFIHEAINTFFLFLNPPDHAIIRNYIAKCWTDHNVSHLIEGQVKSLLDNLPRGKFDLVKDFAQPLPVQVISEIMGIPAKDGRYLRDLGVKMHRSLDLYHSFRDLVQLNEASRLFVKYFKDIMEGRVKVREGGLVSMLIRNRPATIHENHLVSICIFLFIASEETTGSAIGTGLWNLIRRPDLYRYLRTHPKLIPTAADELLRFDPPVQIVGRMATQACVINGKIIPAGASLTLLIGSANRDDKQFDSPDTLQLNRDPNHHLSFSAGAHHCMGDWLGSMQLQIALRCFMERFHEIKLLAKAVKWNNNLAVRGLAGLPVQAYPKGSPRKAGFLYIAPLK